MKKSFKILLIITFCVLIVGCGKSSEKEKKEEKNDDVLTNVKATVLTETDAGYDAEFSFVDDPEFEALLQWDYEELGENDATVINPLYQKFIDYRKPEYTKKYTGNSIFLSEDEREKLTVVPTLGEPEDSYVEYQITDISSSELKSLPKKVSENTITWTGIYIKESDIQATIDKAKSNAEKSSTGYGQANITDEDDGHIRVYVSHYKKEDEKWTYTVHRNMHSDYVEPEISDDLWNEEPVRKTGLKIDVNEIKEKYIDDRKLDDQYEITIPFSFTEDPLLEKIYKYGVSALNMKHLMVGHTRGIGDNVVNFSEYSGGVHVDQTSYLYVNSEYSLCKRPEGRTPVIYYTYEGYKDIEKVSNYVVYSVGIDFSHEDIKAIDKFMIDKKAKILYINDANSQAQIIYEAYGSKRELVAKRCVYTY